MSKKVITREEFEKERKEHAQRMSHDVFLKRAAVNQIEWSTKYKQVHQMDWMGEPTLQLPQDLFAMQEVIRKLRPSLIIELGVCWGGTTLFLSSVQTEEGGGMVLGVDIFAPDDLECRIYDAMDDHTLSAIQLFQASSTAPETLAKIKELVEEWGGNQGKVMMIIDTNHTEEQVLRELWLYSTLASYMVVCDTIVEDLPKPKDRPWGPGNSPRSALNKFLAENKEWERDTEICNKMLFSCQPDGYIKKRDEYD
jgi:cephalosporin hydroxylase